MIRNEKFEKLDVCSFQLLHNPSIPESTRINSQFQVMRGNINRSQTFMGNKFVKSASKPKKLSPFKKRYSNTLKDEFIGKEGEIQGVVQQEKDYKTFKM